MQARSEHVQGPASELRKSQGDGVADKSATPVAYADKNRDGRVTRTEAKADPKLLANFDRYDTDDSDALERAEFARLEADSMQRVQQTAVEDSHQLRPRREFPRPME